MISKSPCNSGCLWFEFLSLGVVSLNHYFASYLITPAPPLSSPINPVPPDNHPACAPSDLFKDLWPSSHTSEHCSFPVLALDLPLGWFSEPRPRCLTELLPTWSRAASSDSDLMFREAAGSSVARLSPSPWSVLFLPLPSFCWTWRWILGLCERSLG